MKPRRLLGLSPFVRRLPNCSCASPGLPLSNDGTSKAVRFCSLDSTIQHLREFCMDIGYRLRSLRAQKKLSQGDVEKRTGLLRCYISRVENGHTVPAVETLEKMARAMEMPLYELLYDGQEPPAPLNGNGKPSDEWGSMGKDARFLNKICRVLVKMSERDRQLLLSFAQNLIKNQRRTAKRS
jgi:transcriptional regulator with XRE-family HTH domain